MDRDVVIVGAGVVGAAIARELSRYELDVTLLEAGSDVGAGTSKANTALLHTGFDAKPGTLEARLVARGHALLSDYAARRGIPLERTGALLVAWDDEQLAELPGIVERSRANGYTAIRGVARDELRRREPHLGRRRTRRARGARRGARLPVHDAARLRHRGGARRLRPAPRDSGRRAGAPPRTAVSGSHDPAGSLTARRVVNAAGLHSDAVDRMLGGDASP